MIAATSEPMLDLIVEPEWLIPIEPAGTVLTNHALGVRDERIVAVLPTTVMRRDWRATETLALPGHVLMPGLINLHCHAAMGLLRGYADDLPLMRWLEQRIWPAERRHASADFVAVGSRLACLEMLRGGITCFNDMYFFPEATAEAALACGIRAALGIVVIDFPTPYARSPDEYLARGAELRARHGDAETLSFCLAPHAPYTVSDAVFERIVALADEQRLPIHIHVHETAAEVAQASVSDGRRPLARLDALGVLGPRTIAVHAVHLNDDEMQLLAQRGTHLAHCPTSNLKLASGIANLAGWERRGLNWGLGSDGAASNNRLDLWQEIRHAALLAKGSSGDAGMLDVHRMLRAATLDGARALGLDAEIGSLTPGKAADMIAVRLDDWLLQPCYDPASHLVYAAGREHVSHVWVAGKSTVIDGVPTNVDVAELVLDVRRWRQKIADDKCTY